MPTKRHPSASAALIAWRTRMRWSQRDAAAALGMTLVGYQELERGSSFGTGKPRPVKRSILLACAALEHELEAIA